MIPRIQPTVQRTRHGRVSRPQSSPKFYTSARPIFCLRVAIVATHPLNAGNMMINLFSRKEGKPCFGKSKHPRFILWINSSNSIQASVRQSLPSSCTSHARPSCGGCPAWKRLATITLKTNRVDCGPSPHSVSESLPLLRN
jgi:hypothetical protein